jgi:diguanylate cyclase (GGDEF)-like protein
MHRGGRGDGRVAVRLGASLFAGGATVTVAANLLPHPAQVDERGYWGMVAVQLLLAALLLLKPRGRSDRWLPAFVTFAGIALVTASVYFNGEKHGGPALFNEFFYVWPALYAGYFFSPRALAAALGTTAASYAIALTAIGAHGATRWLVATTSVVGLAIAAHVLRRQRDQLVHRLRQAVRTDPLTTVLNRRGFDEAFVRELERLARSGDPLSVLVGDLDHFKALNDRFGHAAGDDALASVGATMREACRSIDTVARIGGEEFALLLPDTGARGAFEAAERFRAAVSGTADPAGRPLTISFGTITCADPRATAERLLAAADAALYQAKEQGRDRTVAAPAFRALVAAA